MEPRVARPFDLRGACDSHIHVFGPRKQFPFAADRRYTPPDATFPDYRSLMRTLGIERAVLTAPSVYGPDNRALLNALATGGECFRGIAMVLPGITDAQLREYHELGVRGIRTQLTSFAGKPVSIEELRALGRRIATLGWHVELHVDVSQIEDIDLLTRGFDVPVVIEHMGHMPTRLGLDAPGFQALLRALDSGAWTKLSGAYINSVEGPPYDDVAPFVRALVDVAPTRCVWGSNWPHPHQLPLPDDQLVARASIDWIGTPKLVRQVLTSNAARLYDFIGSTRAYDSGNTGRSQAGGADADETRRPTRRP